MAGANVTVTVHVVPLASDDPQVLDSVQLEDAVIPDMETAVYRSLVRVTVCVALCVFNNCDPKARVFVDATNPFSGSVVSQAPRP